MCPEIILSDTISTPIISGKHLNGNGYNIPGEIKSSYEVERRKKDNTISSDINGVVFSYIFGENSEGQFIMNRMKAKNFLKLQQFLKLPPNWNENGAGPFSDRLIETCKKILDMLPRQPEVFPTATDSIQMEYEKNNGEYMEFNIYEDEINIFRIDSYENENEYVINITENKKLKELVEDFYAKD